MTAVADLADVVGSRRATAALGVSRASYFRQARKAATTSSGPTSRTPSARALSPAERQDVIDVLHADRFADKAPRAIVTALLEEKRYLCSARTMYRILTDHGEVRERRAQRRHPKRPAPFVTASAPNQVWVWDVTKIRGPKPGTFFYLAVIMDLYSRYIVGWTCQHSESAHVAKALFEETVALRGITPGQLIVHADRGSAMKSTLLADLFDTLGIRKSHSRPRCSNDNPHIESAFKTTKYSPSYPGHFLTIEATREYFRVFFPAHNDGHFHSGIGYLTPATVFTGRAQHVIATKQAALDHAYSAHPERFSAGPPVAPPLPATVQINPDRGVTCNP